MADRYWIGGTGTWDATTTRWSTTSGGTGGASVPGASDTAIFDANSGSGNYTVTRNVAANVLSLVLENPTGGNLTMAGTGATGIFNNLSVAAGVTWSNTGGLFLNPTAGTTLTVNTSGISIPGVLNMTQAGFTGTVSLASNFVCTGVFTYTIGNLSLNSYSLTASTLVATNNTNSRTINFGTGAINLTSTTAAAVLVNYVGTAISTSGSRTVNLTGAGSGARSLIMSTGITEANALDINVMAGSGAISMTSPIFRSLDVTGSTSALSVSGTTTCYGSLILSATNYSGTFVFQSSTSGNIIRMNGRSLTGNISFNGLGEWTLQDALTNSSGATLNSGTLNLNNFSLTTSTFTSNNSNIRAINFGTSGSINVTSTSIVWNSSTTTNMSIYGNPVVNVTNSSTSTKTITPGSPSEANSISFNISGVGATTHTVTSGSNVRNLNFTGNTGTWANTAITIFGSLTLSTGMTVTAGSNAITFASTSTGRTIRSNGKVLAFPINFNGLGGSWELSDAMSVGSNAITLTAGTINTAGFSVTALSINTVGSLVKSIKLSSSTVTLSGTGATIPWNIVGSNNTVDAGTSTILMTGAAPSFNGIGLTYNNVTFSNSAVTSINVNGENSYNTLTFATPTAAGYVPVVFDNNQTASSLVITGTTVGNFRLFFKSSVLDSQRTFTVNSVTNLSDIDFRDIVGAGLASWSGTRLGDAGNNLGITFTTPKTVYWSTASASTGGSWSSANWSNVSAATAGSADNFPLPQDTVYVTGASSSFVVTINNSYNVGNVLNLDGGGLRFGGQTVYFMGNLTTTVRSGGGMGTTGTAIFYSRSNAAHTFTVRANSATSWPHRIIIDTNGTVSMTDMAFNSVSINNIFGTVSPADITHQLGTLELQNTTVGLVKYESNYTTPRTLDLGSSSLTLSYAADNNAGFVVDTTNFSTVPGTSTITMSGTTFGIIINGSLELNHLAFTSMNGANTKLMASSSYFNNSESMTTSSLTVNNFSISSNGTAFTNSWIQFSGISNITVDGAFTINNLNAVTQRVTLASFDQITTISATTFTATADIDFTGIAAAGSSAPWSGTRFGDAGRNTNINFDASRTLYWANGTGTFNWYSLGWTTTLGGSAQANVIPMAHDTVIINDTQPAGAITFNILNNFALPNISFTGRTLAVTMSTTGNMIYPGSIGFISSLTWSGTGTIYLTGDSTQTVNTATKNITQAVRIANSGSVQLLANMSITNAAGLTLSAGSLDLNNFVLSMPILSVSSPVSKSISYGTTGSMTVTGNANTVVSIPQSVNNSITSSGNSAINLTYAAGVGTRTINTAGITSESGAMSINVSAGSDIISIGTSSASSAVMNLNTQGFTGTWVHPAALNLYGNLTVGTGVTTIQDVSFNYVGSGSSTLTTNGKTLRGQVVINSVGGGLTQQDNLTLTQFSGGNISYLQLTRGTYSSNNFNTTVDRFVSIGTLTRVLNLGSGTWTLTADDDSTSGTKTWNVNSSGISLSSSSSVIILTGPGTKTFNGGSQTYNNLTISGAGTLSVTGSNAFNTISNTVQPFTLLFAGNIPQSFTNFNISGTAGNLVSVGSTTAIPAILYKPSTWNVGANSVDAGGNTGLTYSSGSSDYLSISNITGTNTTPLSPAIRLSGISTTGGFVITV